MPIILSVTLKFNWEEAQMNFVALPGTVSEEWEKYLCSGHLMLSNSTSELLFKKSSKIQNAIYIIIQSFFS